MTETEFIDFAKSTIRDLYNENIPNDGNAISNNDVSITWQCKALQNWKALLITNTPDSTYYEFTFNGNKSEAYVDKYVKCENRVVKYD